MDLHAPLELPPTPKSSSLVDVFPYLAKLALSEKTLYWRLATALALMVASKVAGDNGPKGLLVWSRLGEQWGWGRLLDSVIWRAVRTVLCSCFVGKLLTILMYCGTGLMAPMYFKHAVDAMGRSAVHASVAALLTSGVCRVVNGVAKEIQHPCFTPISQVRAGFRVCLCASEHKLLSCFRLVCAYQLYQPMGCHCSEFCRQQAAV